jgi:hypothetical protein
MLNHLCGGRIIFFFGGGGQIWSGGGGGFLSNISADIWYRESTFRKSDRIKNKIKIMHLYTLNTNVPRKNKDNTVLI